MEAKRTSADIIKNAMSATRAREGVRTHVRFPRALIARASECAADCGDDLGDWVNKACRQHKAGKFEGVAIDEKTELATRNGSESITVRAPSGATDAEIKRAVSVACSYCEARRVPYKLEVPARYIMAKPGKDEV